MSLAKLTSLSTQTLSLLLERQRLQSIPQFQPSTATPGSTESTFKLTSTSNLHLPQIKRNLNQLRSGILELESKDAAGAGGGAVGASTIGGGEAVGLLKNQYGRMRAMLGEDAESLGIERYVLYIYRPPIQIVMRRYLYRTCRRRTNSFYTSFLAV